MIHQLLVKFGRIVLKFEIRKIHRFAFLFSYASSHIFFFKFALKRMRGREIAKWYEKLQVLSLDVGAVQKRVNLVGIEKCCKMNR